LFSNGHYARRSFSRGRRSRNNSNRAASVQLDPQRTLQDFELLHRAFRRSTSDFRTEQSATAYPDRRWNAKCEQQVLCRDRRSGSKS
jgi:hypothetical protein